MKRVTTKTRHSILAVFILAASALPAAQIDGKWKGESKVKARGEERTIETVFDLQAAGEKLSGTVNMAVGKRSRPMEIKEGRIDGNRFSFTTTAATRRGDLTVKWEGTINGDQIEVTRGGQNRRRGSQALTLKRVPSPQGDAG